MKIDKNIVIKCKNLEEVKDCLNKLQKLGFKVKKMNEYKSYLIVTSSVPCGIFFSNYETPIIDIDKNVVNYDYFLELYKKQKPKQHDFVVDKNEKIIKVNNLKSDKKFYFYDIVSKEAIETVSVKVYGEEIHKDLLIFDFYISKVACEKAIKRKEIESKLRLLAFELNGNRDINFNDDEWKNIIYYDFGKDLIKTAQNFDEKDMNIYCYSEQFMDEAIKLIGEEDLKDYLINC